MRLFAALGLTPFKRPLFARQHSVANGSMPATHHRNATGPKWHLGAYHGVMVAECNATFPCSHADSLSGSDQPKT